MGTSGKSGSSSSQSPPTRKIRPTISQKISNFRPVLIRIICTPSVITLMPRRPIPICRSARNAIPTQINGVDQASLIEVMADMFMRYGSPELQRDVERYRSLIAHYHLGITSLEQAPEILSTLQQHRRRQLAERPPEGEARNLS